MAANKKDIRDALRYGVRSSYRYEMGFGIAATVIVVIGTLLVGIYNILGYLLYIILFVCYWNSRKNELDKRMNQVEEYYGSDEEAV